MFKIFISKFLRPALLLFCSCLFVLQARASYVHLEGKWADVRDKTNSRLFEAFVGKTNYYFVLHDFRPSYKSEQTRDYVATYDGLDCFWTCYRFPISDGDKPIKWPNSGEAMGFGVIDSGSFPSMSVPPLQTLWMALFWPAHTNNYHALGGSFVTCRMEVDGATNYAKEFRIDFTSQDTDNVPCIRFYAPAKHRQKDGSEWLYSALRFINSTNFSERDIPVKFEFIEYGRTKDTAADVHPMMMHWFEVTNMSMADQLPSAFPPTFKGKVLLISDHRLTGSNVLYPINGSKQFEGMFTSKTDPNYKLLENRFAQKESSKVPQSQRIIVLAILAVTTLVLTIFLFRSHWENSKK